MVDQRQYEQQLKEIAEKIDLLADDHDPDCIEQTARRLEKLQYAPPVPVQIETFLRLNKRALQAEADKISRLNDSLENKSEQFIFEQNIQSINILLYYYKKLQLLRDDDPESWDEIDELYVHD